jgi:protein-S-isoprenylcysteine O-methyltransferase Ste14
MRRLGRKRERREIALEPSMLEGGPEVASSPGMQVLTDATRGPGTPFPPTLLFVLGLVFAWPLHEAFPFHFGLAPALTSWLTSLGAVSLTVGTVVFWWGMATFARAQTGIMLQSPASQLVVKGPYRWSRNPMYVGFVAMYFGFSLLVNSVWPILLLPGVIVALEVLVIRREERYLRTVFGPAYEEYCRRVGRWL